MKSVWRGAHGVVVVMIDKQTDRAQSRNLRKALKTSNRFQVVLPLGMSRTSLRERSILTRAIRLRAGPRREVMSEA